MKKITIFNLASVGLKESFRDVSGPIYLKR